MRIDPKRLREARERLGLTQTGLAKALDMPPGTLSRIENGVLSGSKSVAAIAKALDVHPSWLLGGDDVDPDGSRADRLRDQRVDYRAEGNVSQMLAEVLTKMGEQNAEIRYLRNELRETQSRLARLETGIGRSGVGNRRGA